MYIRFLLVFRASISHRMLVAFSVVRRYTKTYPLHQSHPEIVAAGCVVARLGHLRGAWTVIGSNSLRSLVLPFSLLRVEVGILTKGQPQLRRSGMNAHKWRGPPRRTLPRQMVGSEGLDATGVIEII